ncbi:MAG: DUF4331 domain-containing protein, partial [Burkholderiaceae bacterium]
MTESPKRRARGPLFATAAVAGALAIVATGASQASSHREAPFITTMPKVDATDFYMFHSYEPGREGFVTIVANYLPLQDAYGGPNYFALDQNALYEIHIDNDGDAKEDITFQFRFKEIVVDIALNIAGKSVAIPLIQAGPITAPNGATQNRREVYSVDVIRGARRGERQPVKHAGTGATQFEKPLDNIGPKTFSGTDGYAGYAWQFAHPVAIPGCQPGRMFVGQRKDPFAIPLGRVFDLVNLNPLGAPDAYPDDLATKNVTALVLEVPIACLTQGTDPVIGGWTTASMRQGRLLDGTPA